MKLKTPSRPAVLNWWFVFVGSFKFKKKKRILKHIYFYSENSFIFAGHKIRFSHFNHFTRHDRKWRLYFGGINLGFPATPPAENHWAACFKRVDASPHFKNFCSPSVCIKTRRRNSSVKPGRRRPPGVTGRRATGASWQETKPPLISACMTPSRSRFPALRNSPEWAGRYPPPPHPCPPTAGQPGSNLQDL